MDFVTWARSPWGEDILTHISWSLFYASLFGGILFLLAHGSYMLFSRHHKREESVDRMEAARPGLPARIRATQLRRARLYWVMAVSMLTLVVTAFFPIVGIRFAWVRWHWIAGLLRDGIHHLPHHSRDVLPGLLVNLGRTAGHSGNQS